MLLGKRDAERDPPKRLVGEKLRLRTEPRPVRRDGRQVPGVRQIEEMERERVLPLGERAHDLNGDVPRPKDPNQSLQRPPGFVVLATQK